MIILAANLENDTGACPDFMACSHSYSWPNLFYPLPTLQLTGCTPIVLAARRGHLKLVERLFSNGADVNITDNVCKLQYNNMHVAYSKSFTGNILCVPVIQCTYNSAISKTASVLHRPTAMFGFTFIFASPVGTNHQYLI